MTRSIFFLSTLLLGWGCSDESTDDSKLSPDIRVRAVEDAFIIDLGVKSDAELLDATAQMDAAVDVDGTVQMDAAIEMDAAQVDATAPVDAATGGPCVPSANSLVCTTDTTLSLCIDDIDFDGNSDGPPQTVQLDCRRFFRDVGAASCETFDNNTTEALCTMDDGGPCGVILITGQVTTARCTSDNAVCLLNLEIQNYACTPNTGIECETAGPDFIPFCSDNLMVWRCTDDGDGINQPHVDDCTALGNGRCDAEQGACVDIEEGGRCNLTEWFCADGLRCSGNVCVPN